MSQLTYYEINPHRPNTRYHISYHTGQSVTEKPKFRKLIIDSWKKIGGEMKVQIPLHSSFADNISDDVGKINFDGFELDLNKMETEKKYTLSYDDSLYEVFKNTKNELVISEIGWWGSRISNRYSSCKG